VYYIQFLIQFFFFAIVASILCSHASICSLVSFFSRLPRYFHSDYCKYKIIYIVLSSIVSISFGVVFIFLFFFSEHPFNKSHVCNIQQSLRSLLFFIHISFLFVSPEGNYIKFTCVSKMLVRCECNRKK
jgi:hypothetical protein